MLTIAIATFFALAFAGALLVIGLMFVQYHGKIRSVIQSGIATSQSSPASHSPTYRHRTVKTQQLATRHRSLQSAPLRAAA